MRKPFWMVPPGWVRWMYPGACWRVSTAEPTLYLTFDDGPNPEVTPWVCAQLAKYGMKATFFCIGQHVKAHPEVMQLLQYEGHAVANHSMHHVKGWHTSVSDYVQDVLQCQGALQPYSNALHDWFRPPYGKCTPLQQFQLHQKGFRLLLWDFLTYDFDANANMDTVVLWAQKSIRPGSILVMHDSHKAFYQLKQLLPALLQCINQMGYKAEVLPSALLLHQRNQRVGI